MSRVIEVHDDLLEPHVAELISAEMKNLKWNYYYNSTIKVPGYHWHIFCGDSPEQVIENGYEIFIPIWEAAKHKLNLEERFFISGWKRLYANAHTFGVEPNIHQDDGDFTMIYYPQLDWDIKYGGGTFVYKEDGKTVDRIAEYKGNRVLLFDAYLPHQAQPVAKNCQKLRTCIVFKLWVEAANRERLDFYK
jgi:hypothetical protein